MRNLLAIALTLAMTTAVYAADEVARGDGALESGLLLNTVTSTSSVNQNRKHETRRALSTPDGRLYTAGAVANRSTFTTVVSNTATYIVNSIDKSTSANNNPNVFAIAYPTNPVTVTHITAAPDTPNNIRVRIFDTRGSTGPNNAEPLNCVFDTNLGSGTWPVMIDLTSGLTFHKGTLGKISLHWTEHQDH